jgi:RNA polymerase sigma factor (sigma-70 family)
MATLAAARLLFERQRPWALSVAGAALRRIGPKADGEELRQVAQVATWERALAFEPGRWTIRPIGDPFQLYAYPSVYGACLMAAYRGAAGRATTRDGDAVGFLPIEAADDAPTCGGQCLVDSAIDGHHRTQTILAILDELPKRERHLVAEHYLGGVSLSAIAESLHTSPASVSRIHASALGMLRNAVARRGMRAGEWL